MDLWTKENIWNYTGDPDVESDKKYSKEMQKVRKEIRKIDKETKAQGGVIDWNYMLNDMMLLCSAIQYLKEMIGLYSICNVINY